MPTQSCAMILIHDPQLTIPLALQGSITCTHLNTYFPQADCLCQRCTACIQIHSPKLHGGSIIQILLLQHSWHRIHKYHIPSHLEKAHTDPIKISKVSQRYSTFFLNQTFASQIFSFFTYMNYMTDFSMISCLGQVSRQNDYFKVQLQILSDVSSTIISLSSVSMVKSQSQVLEINTMQKISTVLLCQSLIYQNCKLTNLLEMV